MGEADEMIELVVGYTTAPRNYDGFGTVEFDAEAGTDHRGYALRKVGIRPEHYEWQVGRYWSGTHGFVAEAEARRFPQLYLLRPAGQEGSPP